MSKPAETSVTPEFNSPEGIAIATKAVAAAKTREDVVTLFKTRPGNVGHKVLINLLLNRAPIKSKS